MKSKLAFAFVLVLLATALAYGAAEPAQKAITDMAEYRAYTSALELQDPAQKAAALEAFVAKYPESVVKFEAIEQALAAYQEAGNQAKMHEIASNILKLSPDNLRALATITYLKRSEASAQAAPEARALGLKGLELLSKQQKPEDMQEQDFQNLQKQMTAIFASACGFGALQAKEYPAARNCYLKSLQINPDNLTDSFQMGVAQLEMEPLDPHGFWYVAKALSLAKGNAAALEQISGYGKGNYARYHGSEDGWEQLVAHAAAQSEPPAGFAITRAAAPKPAPAPKRPRR